MSQGKDLKLERIVKANARLAAGFWFYITLEANDKCFYEVLVFYRYNGSFKLMKLFRRALYSFQQGKGRRRKVASQATSFQQEKGGRKKVASQATRSVNIVNGTYRFVEKILG